MKLDQSTLEVSPPAAKPQPRFLKRDEAALLAQVCITLCDAVIQLADPMDAARLLAARALLSKTSPDDEVEEVKNGEPF